MRRTPQQLRRTAYHEAGHAVQAERLGVRFTRVTIRSEGDSLGCVSLCDWMPNGDDLAATVEGRDGMERDMMVSLAGQAAERRKMGRASRHGWSGDRDSVVELALRFAGTGEQATVYVRWLELRVRDFISSPLGWSWVDAVARELLERETLTEDEVKAAMTAVVENLSQL